MHNILIVDDHAGIRASVCELFQSALTSVICGQAENGAEAILKARELKPDLVVLDLSMPVMDGLETAKILRQLFPEIAIVMLTAHSMEGTKLAAEQVGIRAVFSKHQDLTKLVAHARDIFQNALHPAPIE